MLSPKDAFEGRGSLKKSFKADLRPGLELVCRQWAMERAIRLRPFVGWCEVGRESREDAFDSVGACQLRLVL